MEAIDLLNIILAVSSATLSITAIVFSWITYRNSTKMQMDAQAILEKITQRVEVVVQSTTTQIDKAWNYITNTNHNPKSDIPEVQFDLDSLKQKFIDETKVEVIALIKNLSTDKNTIDELSNKVEFLIQKTTNVTEELILKQTLINNLQSLPDELNDWAKRVTKTSFAYGVDLSMMIDVLEHDNLIPDILLMKFNYIIDIRNKIIHNGSVNSIELQNSLLTVDEIRKILKGEKSAI
jgi:hypothetical protein